MLWYHRSWSPIGVATRKEMTKKGKKGDLKRKDIGSRRSRRRKRERKWKQKKREEEEEAEEEGRGIDSGKIG